MKRTAAVLLLFALAACTQQPKDSTTSSEAGATVTPATDTSSRSKLKDYTAPAQEDRLRKVSADTAQKSNP